MSIFQGACAAEFTSYALCLEKSSAQMYFAECRKTQVGILATRSMVGALKKCTFCIPFTSWIRIRIQTKLLDSDPKKINADPQPCQEQCFSATSLNLFSLLIRHLQKIHRIELLNIILKSP